MRSKIFINFGLLSLLFLAACEQASTTVVAIPNVSLQCESATNAGCNAGADGRRAFVFMTRSGCGESATFDPVASSDEALNCDASGCSVEITSWVGADSSSPVTEIISGSMDICSRIDLVDPLTSEDSGDLINESNQNIQSNATITIDSWTEI